MTMTPGGLSVGGNGRHAKPRPAPVPAIDGRLPLIIQPDAGEIRSIEISPGSRLVAGSADAADLSLPGMAPQHGVFYVLAGQWAVASFTSAHCSINDRQMFGPHVLHRGDRVQFGTVAFTIESA